MHNCKSTVTVIIAGMCMAILATNPGCRQPQMTTVIDQPEPDYSRQLPPGQLALRKIDPSQWPDFAAAYGRFYNLDIAIAHSLNYLRKPSSQQYYPYGDISHDQTLASLVRFRDLLRQATSTEHFVQALQDEFDVYESVGYDGEGTVFFTGYYCPIFDASTVPTERFKWPLYKKPDDLVVDDDGNVMGRQTNDGSIVPYYTRREIVGTDTLKGNELVYLADRFEAYVVTVQGSARLRMPDDSMMEIGFAASNGHEYTSVGRALVADGKIPADKLSLSTMIDYFNQHPEHLGTYLPLNDRYVFFTERTGGPYGSLNEPVTPMRSIATDKQVFPRAALSFLDTTVPIRLGATVRQMPYKNFALDQDTGGAIRAAGRCDIYMGIGDEAGILAGRQLAEGRLYYLFLKPSAMTQDSPEPPTQDDADAQ